jgi:redox-sensing transcriptional repressor
MLSAPSRERLTSILFLIIEWIRGGRDQATSGEIARVLGQSKDTVRRDLSLLNLSSAGKAYELNGLLLRLQQFLNVGRMRRGAIAGLGDLGSRILERPSLLSEDLKIVAGFDSRQNKLDVIVTSIRLFPSYEIPQRVSREDIELGIIAVPDQQAQLTATRFTQGGVKAIINLTNLPVNAPGSRIPVLNLGWKAKVLNLLTTIE